MGENGLKMRRNKGGFKVLAMVVLEIENGGRERSSKKKMNLGEKRGLYGQNP